MQNNANTSPEQNPDEKKAKLNIQGDHLQKLMREHTSVAIYLVNGIKLIGTIARFDQYCIILRSTHEQMIYKHAIATVGPAGSSGGPRDERPRRDR